MQINLNSLNSQKEIEIEKHNLKLPSQTFDAYNLTDVVCDFEGKVAKEGDEVVLTGKAKFAYNAPCSKCGEQTSKVQEIFINEHFDQKSMEISPAIEQKTLDICQVLCENLLLEIPSQILCKESCKGICGKCGKNLNEGNCNCDKDREGIVDTKNPFYKLKMLLRKKEK